MTMFKRLLTMALLLPVLPVFAKGGGDTNPVTESERVNAEVAARTWNDYVEGLKPATEAYVADVRSPVASKVAQVQGMANADFQQQQVQLPALDPNKTGRMNAAKTAGIKSGLDMSAEAGVQMNKAKQLQGVLDVGQGKAATATAGMSDLASMAAGEAIAKQEADYNTDASTTRSIAGAAGMATGMATDGKKPKDWTVSV